jgi:hypothetical protein
VHCTYCLMTLKSALHKFYIHQPGRLENSVLIYQPLLAADCTKYITFWIYFTAHASKKVQYNITCLYKTMKCVSVYISPGCCVTCTAHHASNLMTERESRMLNIFSIPECTPHQIVSVCVKCNKCASHYPMQSQSRDI